MSVFLVSDTHFGHANIIKYCDRPFENTEEMDKFIIRKWNETIGPEDTVFHLGDIGFGSREYIAAIVSQLNGYKHLVRGNHDNYSDDFYRRCGFQTVSRFPIIWNNFAILSHAPLQMTETTPYCNFYGHIHNDEKYVDTETSKCVCVEKLNYIPYKVL